MAALRITAFGLRGASAGARFLLVMYLASVGDSALLGRVAIIATIVTLFTQVAGLEVNQVVGRRLHGLNAGELVGMLRGQAAACIGAYTILVPVVFLVYPELLLPHWLCFGLILILEHFITEVYRLNILLLRPNFASCLLFIKNAGWVILFVGLTSANLVPMTLSLLLYSWAGVLLLTAVPLIVMAWRHHSRHDHSGILAAVRGIPALVKEASPFVVSAILTASIGSIDKLLVGTAFSMSELGVFYVFYTLASILTLVVTFSVGATSGPACIKIHTTQGQEAFTVCLRRLKRQYWSVIVVTATFILIFANPLLAILNKQSYASRFDILFMLIVSAAFVSLCDPYKLDEYLSKRDGNLVIGNAFHLISLVLAVGIGASTSEIYAVAAGVMLSSMLTFIFFHINGPRRVALWAQIHR